MKNFKVISLLSILTITLTGCFNDKEGSLEWASPEKFFEQAQINYTPKVTCSKYEDDSLYFYDEDWNIQKAVLDVGYFYSVNKQEPKNSRNFNYYCLRSNATSGPNYCQMTVYADGLMIIDYKSSLSPHYYYYYTMDDDKAIELIEMVEKRFQHEPADEQLESYVRAYFLN